MKYGGMPRSCAAIAAVAAMMAAAPAQAQSVRINGLEDVTFGTITTLFDQSNSQNVMVCSYRNAFNSVGYSVTASGTGAGGSFELSSGGAALPYDVQWADSPNQTGGTLLQPGTPAVGFGNAAPGWPCRFLRYDTASLTVTIRGPDLASAQAGAYSGTLQITIAPE